MPGPEPIIYPENTCRVGSPMSLDLTASSVAVIRAGQAQSGAYVASPNFSQYGYSWFRDGAWIAYAMDLYGHHDSAGAFHRWAAGTVMRYAGQVDMLLGKLARGETPDERDYLPTRFTLDGALGQDDWTDFQLDGYGAWLWVLVQHCRTVDAALWDEVRPAVNVLVRYLSALWQSPNYDCWEEFRDRVHTATLAALYGGLKAVAEFDAVLVPDGLLEQILAFVRTQGIGQYGGLSKFIPQDPSPGKRVDASLLWSAVPFGMIPVDDPLFQATLRQIERDVRGPGGGVHRYRDDVYFGGGQWPLLTAWLGWVYVSLGRIDDAYALRDWIAQQATPDRYLPEQVAHHMLEPSAYDGWVAKWGESANPLLWSHAMYLILEHALRQQGSSS